MPDLRRLFLTVGAPILGALLSVWLVFTITSVDRNVLAQLMEYLGYAGFTLGIFWPRAGFLFLIGVSGYLDFFKRLLVLTGDINWYEIIDVLKVAPLTLSGVFVGLVLKRWLQGMFFSRVEWFIFWFVSAFGLLSVGLAYKDTKFLFAAIATTANTSVYLLLLLIVPLMIDTKQDVVKLIRFMVFVFSPVAIYGIYQGFFGLPSFEIEYLKTGYTINIKELYDVRPRPLSTLNSNQSFAVVMSALFILSTGYQMFNARYRQSTFFWILNWIVPLIYFIALMVSLARTSWIMGIMGIFLIWIFKNWKMILVFYLSFIGTLISIIVNSRYLLDWLDRVKGLMPTGSDLQEQIFRIGTYVDRLISYNNLMTNPKYLTLFGNRELMRSGGLASHDAITDLVVNYGIVGLSVVVAVLSFVLFRIHREILLTEDWDCQFIGRILISIIIGVLVTGAFTGGQLHIFPINLFFWLILGMLLKTFLFQQPLKAR
jgi:hypothetical protein